MKLEMAPQRHFKPQVSPYICTVTAQPPSVLKAFVLSHSYNGGNDENKLFYFIFKKLPSVPKYKLFADAFQGADILIISDFIWSHISTENINLIEKARNKGMKFYGLGIDVSENQLDVLENPDRLNCEIRDGYTFLKQCDYRYLYKNGSVFEYLKKPLVL